MNIVAEEAAPYHVTPPKHELWSHEFLDALSLARHGAMAETLRCEPALVQIARDNARRLLASGNDAEAEARSAEEWLPLLDRARFDELLAIMEHDVEDATRMRQSSPLTGILSEHDYRSLREQLIQDFITLPP